MTDTGSSDCEFGPLEDCGPSFPRRLGKVIELRPDHKDLYIKVHADSHEGVRDLLAKYGLRNFSIFLRVRPSRSDPCMYRKGRVIRRTGRMAHE